MNKVNSTIFGLAFIVLLCGAASAQINVNQTGWWNAGGTTFHAINPGQIQAAIDNADAGDTIYVYNGTYSENVDVDKQLTLVGEGADVVTVTAANPNDHVFCVTTNYVNISGFTATGATGTNSRGIYLHQVQHCKISENNASGNYYGIVLYSSSDNTLTSNTANSNTRHGIWMCYSSDNNTLTSNTANSNTQDGIGVWYSSDNNTLTENTANSNTQDGIGVWYSSDNNVSCNWVQNNTEAGFRLVGGSTGNTIANNSIIANGMVQAGGSYRWQFRNDQSYEVSTVGNWWGTADTTIINASIYDRTYDAYWGSVTTAPRLSGPAPCAPVPELPTIALLAVGLLMLAGYVRIERKKDE